MSHHALPDNLSADQALARLLEGNRAYVANGANAGDVSAAARARGANEGQAPYAVVVACSDSRVIPEVAFNAGLGEIFVIRVAGNVIDDHQMGSIEYAVEHLGSRLVLVLGHTQCGAVAAAMEGSPDGHIKYITDQIGEAIERAGGVADAYEACCANAHNAVAIIEGSLEIQEEEAQDGLRVLPAIFDIETGAVELL